MADIPQHRQDLIEDVHLFLGVFEDLQTLASFGAEHQAYTPHILEIVADRYTALSDRLTAELRDHKPLALAPVTECQNGSDNPRGKAGKSPEALQNKGSERISAKSTYAHNV